MKSIAIVTPWFGPEMTGGAERQAFQIATRLAARGHSIEVLTTCNGGFSTDWSLNHYDPGETKEFGLTIRRFAVDKRDSENFDRVNAQLLRLASADLRAGVSPLTPVDASVFVSENIKSAALLDYLRLESDVHSAFIFLPYMFQSTTSGALLVAERAWLQPCLHNEPAAYLPEIAESFRRVRGLLFNSNAEYELALELFGPGIIQRSVVIGEGIEPLTGDGDLPSGLVGRSFLLYLGRRESVKNIELLLSAFRRFRANHPGSSLELVLAGPGPANLSGPGIVDLGLVSEEVKAALLRSARAIAQPSLNESFSRTMMEAWLAGHPVVVHASCQATAEAVLLSGGGWTAATEEEWAELFYKIDQASAAELMRIGKLGQRYAHEHANWDAIIPRYEELLELSPTQTRKKSRTNKLQTIHQLLPDMVYGDAISNQALAIRNQLRSEGYESEIFVKRRDPRVSSGALLFAESQPERNAGLLYHHSIGSDLTGAALSHEGPKCLIYHNVTPAQYFAPFRPGFAWLLETGRKSLKHLAPYFEISVGDSAYNAQELAANGFSNPGVLPIVINPERWDLLPDESLMRRLQDGKWNILFTGRVAPNKKQDRLIEAFHHFHQLEPESRLIIAGEGRLSDPYFHEVLERIKRHRLESAVEVTGLIEESTLYSYYRAAHLFWSFSEHEGFGAPLIEAMWFDVPVYAFGATAVSETLGPAGELFETDEDISQIAQHARRLIVDEQLRKSVIQKQRLRRLDFTPDAVWPILRSLTETLESVPVRAVA